jgi:excisionase family DNA binding protein
VSDPFPSGKRRQQASGYLSKGRFAELMDVSRQTIWRMVRDGRIRTVKLSSTIERIPLSEIDRLSQQSEHEQPSPRKRRKRLDVGHQDDDPQGDPTETDLK